jgi:hypothetical protein
MFVDHEWSLRIPTTQMPESHVIDVESFIESTVEMADQYLEEFSNGCLALDLHCLMRALDSVDGRSSIEAGAARDGLSEVDSVVAEPPTWDSS